VKVTTRPAQPGDRELVRSIHHRAFREVVERQFGWDEEDQDRFFAGDWDDGRGLEILEVDGFPAGYVAVDTEDDALSVRQLVIAPEYQDRGTGTTFLRDVCARARRCMVPVRLGCLRANRASELYLRLGFRLTAEDDRRLHFEWSPLAESIEGCGAAHRRLSATLDGLDDATARGPSRLPDWTVGHVLTHLARNADSHVRILDAAARGESVEQYAGGYAQRAADIEAGASRSAAELVADVAATAAALEDRWKVMPPHAWSGAGLAGGRPWPTRLLPFHRWREVEVHPSTWGWGTTPMTGRPCTSTGSCPWRLPPSPTASGSPPCGPAWWPGCSAGWPSRRTSPSPPGSPSPPITTGTRGPIKFRAAAAEPAQEPRQVADFWGIDMAPKVESRHRLRGSAAPFIVFHLSPLLAFVTGVTAKALLLGIGLYLLRMLAITAGYHRYFSHRTYSMSRPLVFLVGFVGTMAAQRGPLWWAAHHRNHHKYADTERDPHSPMRGFWWSHVGWILSGKYSHPDYSVVDDLTKYPELVFINRHDWIGPWVLGVSCFLFAGWSGLVVGFLASTIVVWHCTFSINSLSHVVGKRRYATPDTSRNSWWLAVFTLGEGWHNNHHHFPRSVRQGFYWWELDVGYAFLRTLSWFRIVTDLKVPSRAALAARRVSSGHFDLGRFRQHLAGAVRSVPDHATDLRLLLDEVSEKAAKINRSRMARPS
jgi:stearoyl-CoA desaturase (delta-9 desaturase)